ncbi:hypothetical protein TPA0908_56610 [Micromonospora sp. AKA38]|nr:hypothetical protein TPA0908_56610 [Micromonospora sp. AKA38]
MASGVLVLCCCGGGVAAVSGSTDEKPTSIAAVSPSINGGDSPAAVASPAGSPSVITPVESPSASPTTGSPNPAPRTAAARPTPKPKPTRTSPRPTPKRTTSAPRTTKPSHSTVQGSVHPGAFCKPEGALGHTAKGTLMRCTRKAGEDQPRWRAA